MGYLCCCFSHLTYRKRLLLAGNSDLSKRKQYASCAYCCRVRCIWMTNTKQSPMQTESGEQHRQFPSIDLKKPPIVETSLGCFFSAITGWNVLHFGALFESFRGKYPNVEFPPPVVEQPQLPVTVSWTPGDLLIPIR